MEPGIDRVLLSEEEIRSKVAELADRISSDYRGRDLLLIGILKGGIVFLADLSRAISIPHEFDLIGASSYGRKTTSSGHVRITKDIENVLHGKDVLLVEDIYGHETWWNLTVIADWTPPDLVVTSPLDVNTTDEWVEITGTVDEDARLFIQGSLVLLREGSFSVKYPIYVGESAVTVRAEDGIGNHRELVVYVYRREVSVEPPGPDPWETYIFLVIIPIMMVAVFLVLRRLELGGEGS